MSSGKDTLSTEKAKWRGGRAEETGEDSKEGGEKTCWPAAGRLGREAGCRTGLGGPRGADGRTEGGGRGNRDQFCQNWVHTLGATELGWPGERGKRRAAALFISSF